MRSFSLYIARRIFASSDKLRVSRPAVTIATVGVAIGLAVMLITTSVVLGFKHTIRDKVVGFGSHITVGDLVSIQGADQYPVVMDDSMKTGLRAIPGVSHVQPFALKQGILKTDQDFLGVMLKGVDQDYDLSFIRQNMVSGELPTFSSTQSQNKLVVSKQMADKLHLKTGQRVFAYFIDHRGVRTRRLTISGIYQTNLTRFDETICLTDLYTCRKLNAWEDDQASGAELMVSNFDSLAIVADRVVDRVNRTVDHYGATYASMTVQELNAQIFSWLDLMDLNVWLILALMVCVAAVTMVSGLLIIILERTQMIGLLKALGARNAMVRHTFLWLATLIIGRGLVLGNVLGLGILALQEWTGMISLDPQTYYVSTVPLAWSWLLFAALNVATLLICVLVLIVPSFLVAHIHPARTMQYE